MKKVVLCCAHVIRSCHISTLTFFIGCPSYLFIYKSLKLPYLNVDLKCYGSNPGVKKAKFVYIFKNSEVTEQSILSYFVKKN